MADPRAAPRAILDRWAGALRTAPGPTVAGPATEARIVGRHGSLSGIDP